MCGHELMAHRAVLACCSPYLFEIFNSDAEPHGVSHVTFEDLDPEAVEILLNYAYTAQLVAFTLVSNHSKIYIWKTLLVFFMLWHLFFMFHRLKADKELVKEVYTAAKRFKMERVKQVCHLCTSSLTLYYHLSCVSPVFFILKNADIQNVIYSFIP